MNTPHDDRLRAFATDRRHTLQFFVLKRVGTESDAQDIAQEALATAAECLPHFRGDAELSTWVFGIAHNLARNHMARAPERRHDFTLPEVLDDLVSPWPGPCDQLMQREALHELSVAMQSLPAASADALVLVAIDGLSYEEAGQRLGMTAGTVRSRVFRARAAIRQQLGQPTHEVP